MNGLRLEKMREITILLGRNLAVLFFDIATQAFGGFGSENDSFFGMKKGWRDPESGRENRCNSPSPEVQYPKPEYEKEPFWTSGGS